MDLNKSAELVSTFSQNCGATARVLGTKQPKEKEQGRNSKFINKKKYQPETSEEPLHESTENLSYD